MQIKDLFVSEALTVPPGQDSAQPGQEPQEVGKLTATVSALQKQVADLQKAALQQSAAQQQAKPGEASQQQQPTGTVGTGQSNGTVAQKGAPMGTTADGSMLDMIKKLAGVGQPPVKTAAQPMGQKPQAPGVNQTPQMTNLKIKQDLAKSQGKST